MKTITEPFDVAEMLENEDIIAGYIDEALETNDPAFIAKCLGDVARARGMTQVAGDAGLTRASLYKSLGSNGNPEFATILNVLKALGFRLHVSPVA